MNPSQETILFTLLTLIALGALVVGASSFIYPTLSAQLYGVPTPVLSQFPPDGTDAKKSQTPVSEHMNSSYGPLLSCMAARNFSTGLALLSLAIFWHLDMPRYHAPPVARLAVQHAIGIVVVMGSMVPGFDAAACFQLNQGAGRRMGWVHVARGSVWIGTGVLCLTLRD